MKQSTSKIMKRIKAVLDTIFSVWGASDKAGHTMKKNDKTLNVLGFPTREAFMSVISSVSDFSKATDASEINDALHDDPDAIQEFTQEFDRLRSEIQIFHDNYVHYADDVEIFNLAVNARQVLLDMLSDVYTTGTIQDSNKLSAAIDEFTAANIKLADEVYRADIGDTPYTLPTFDDDAPMTWPEPCQSELSAYLPSIAESAGKGVERPWANLNLFIAHAVRRKKGEGSVTPLDCITRLWCKSNRLHDGQWISDTMMAQIPRWVMYPFYREFFRLMNDLHRSTCDYREGRLDPITRGSTAIKHPGPSAKCPSKSIYLPCLMERLLLFAPRAYFSSGCNHNSYMGMCRMVIDNTMGALRTVFPNLDTREITRDTTAITEGFGSFIISLRESPQCTRKEYLAKVREIIIPFREALNQLSDDLYAIECEMRKVKPNPKRTRKGIKHERTHVPAWKAALWAGVGIVTIRRYWKNPKYGLPRPPLNDTTDPETALRKWGDLYRAKAKGRHEANMKNHATPMSSLSKGSRYKTGV